MAHTCESIEFLVMRALCKRVRSGFARSMLNEETLFLNSSIDVHSYGDSRSFAADLMLHSLLRKWKGWNTGSDCEVNALGSWTTAERKNLETNLRLDSSEFPKGISDCISAIRNKILKVIGVEPDFSKIDRLCRWGPGATFDVSRANASVSYKMSHKLSITSDAVRHFLRVSDTKWTDAFGGYLEVVRGNRCVMVPKNAKTHRMISAEPTANSFLQQGVGRFIRGRLKHFGVDLNDQTINQDLAFRALADGFATIDLSMASDTLCRGIVDLLLPPKWTSYLNDIRSPMSLLNGKWFRLEKFSSMGNAFTFELETLIFWAICSVICYDDPNVSVYGDDIVIPKGSYADVTAALKWFGFTPNLEKSFCESRFFESCGKQYFDLDDVTPPYQKEVCNGSLFELIRFHNRLLRWGLRTGMLNIVLDSLKIIRDFTRNRHRRLRSLPEIPLSESDSGFIVLNHDFKKDINGDFVCLQLEPEGQYLPITGEKAILGLYAYKLRNPSFQNALPDGSCALVTGTRLRLRRRRFWQSQVIDHLS